MKNLLKQRPNTAKLRSLSWSRKLLLLRVFTVLTAYKCLLLFIPISRFIKKTSPTHQTPKLPPQDQIDAIIWVIRVLSQRIPLSFTCLVQALSAKQLLNNHPDVRLCIGVHKSDEQDFSAHAWVVYNNKIILGGQTAHLFQPILEWN